jgi:hypothetical protein
MGFSRKARHNLVELLKVAPCWLCWIPRIADYVQGFKTFGAPVKTGKE